MPKTKLQIWMTANDVDDEAVARHIGRSRVQISRIRRGLSFASIKTAMRLQQLTGMKWHDFVNQEEAPPPPKRSKRKKPARAPAQARYRGRMRRAA